MQFSGKCFWSLSLFLYCFVTLFDLSLNHGVAGERQNSVSQGELRSNHVKQLSSQAMVSDSTEFELSYHLLFV
jgi:hypothetical protein